MMTVVDCILIGCAGYALARGDGLLAFVFFMFALL